MEKTNLSSTSIFIKTAKSNFIAIWSQVNGILGSGAFLESESLAEELIVYFLTKVDELFQSSDRSEFFSLIKTTIKLNEILKPTFITNLLKKSYDKFHQIATQLEPEIENCYSIFAPFLVSLEDSISDLKRVHSLYSSFGAVQDDLFELASEIKNEYNFKDNLLKELTNFNQILKIINFFVQSKSLLQETEWNLWKYLAENET